MTSAALNTHYYRPIAQTDAIRPGGALALAGGAVWFSHVVHLRRDARPEILSVAKVPGAVLDRLSAPRADICGLTLDRPRLMGILNTTPDSFSDGGRFDGFGAAVGRGRALIAEGADMLDIGGESTRPGASVVDSSTEISRTAPVIKALSGAIETPISIDTRKADVAAAAMAAGAAMINDVSALGYDAAMLDTVHDSGAPVCLMHAQGDPKTMQTNPVYQNVLLDVYDYLAERVQTLEARGIARSRMVVDPGIGFGKTQDHNLALIRGLSLFHGLGCAVLLGVSRKRMIATIGGAKAADNRAPGSIALGLEAVRQGVQLLRVHDIADTRQALALWQAAR